MGQGGGVVASRPTTTDGMWGVVSIGQTVASVDPRQLMANLSPSSPIMQGNCTWAEWFDIVMTGLGPVIHDCL